MEKLAQLKRAGPQGEIYEYFSVITEVLGWIIARMFTDKMKLNYLIIIAFCLFSSCKQATNSIGSNQIQPWADSLTAELNEIYKQGLINGYGVAIVNKNGTLYQNGFGYADVKNKKKYTDHTVQNIASISKTLLNFQ